MTAAGGGQKVEGGGQALRRCSFCTGHLGGEHEPDCLLAPPMRTCLVHLIRHPAEQECPTCGAYIAAGL